MDCRGNTRARTVSRRKLVSSPCLLSTAYIWLMQSKGLVVHLAEQLSPEALHVSPQHVCWPSPEVQHACTRASSRAYAGGELSV